MKWSWLILLLILPCSTGFGQNFQKINLEIVDEHDLYVNDGESKSLHYYIKMPEQKAKGIIVLMPASGEQTEAVIKQLTFEDEVIKNNLAIAVVSINWGTDDRKPEIEVLNQVFKQLVEKKGISKNKFIVGGLSNGGVISLKYALTSVKNPNQTYLKPCGIIGIDTPLDMIRLFAYCERELVRNFSDVGMAEAKWMMDYYTDLYGGTPTEAPEAYIENSIYSMGVKDGGNAQYFADMPVIMFSDLDTEWLINERNRDLYDWNGVDLVAFVNQAKLLGNANAHVHISQGKGQRLDGSRHPHSWSIVDADALLKWLLEITKD